MRVGIVGIQHESNTFLSVPTTNEHFQSGAILTGAEIRREYGDAHHELSGFFSGMDHAGIEAVPLFFAWSLPSGAITDETARWLIESLLDAVDAAGPLDGLLVAPHGAAVSEPYPDFDGHWLTLLREKVGSDLPMIGTLDPHANLSQKMVDATNALIAYRSNPHLDQRQVGRQAADLMTATLRGELNPVQAAALPPLSINIERQLTSASPCLEMYRLADAMLERLDVVANSVILGFPYADVEEMGSAFIVVTNQDEPLARKSADELAAYLVEHRSEFQPQLIDIGESLDRASTAASPVCLLDMGDNVGGGSPGDSTHLLHALYERQVAGSFVCLYDPESVRKAVDGGVGNRVYLELGGKTDDRHGKPLEAEVSVVSLHDGKFSEHEARHGGRTHYDMGTTVIVETDRGQTVMLTSRRMVPFSLAQLTSCGIVPSEYQILVAKGVHAPTAAYAPVCPTLIRVNTPGATTADMQSLEFHHRRRPLFPFEDSIPHH